MDAAPTGGPASCCGSPKDASARIAEGMARRTVTSSMSSGRGQVVTWCPSCHMNMQDSMAPVTPTNFSTVHVTEALWARRDRLAPLLARRVEARVLVHVHHGFNGRVAVNDLVPGLLRLIPGVTVADHPYRAPGHMCSSIAAVPGALADAQRATLAAMAETGAGTLCTIFHSCHREAVALERHGIQVRNWIICWPKASASRPRMSTRPGATPPTRAPRSARNASRPPGRSPSAACWNPNCASQLPSDQLSIVRFSFSVISVHSRRLRAICALKVAGSW